MKTIFETFCKFTIALFVFVALASHSMVGKANAQTFTTIKSFGSLTNVTGIKPESKLVQGQDGALYGTTFETQVNAIQGTVFKVQPDGSGFAVIKYFTNASEGLNPVGELTLSGNTLYGATSYGGTWDAGTVFKLNTDGTGYTMLKSFDGISRGPLNSEGFPNSVTVSGNVLYGTTSGVTAYGQAGTVFKLNTDGTGYSVVKNFAGTGANPVARLTLSGSVLYGTTWNGGSSGYGMVFEVNVDGTGYTVLKNFNGTDGARPVGSLLLSGNTLYGTTYSGGNFDDSGVVFKVNTDGTGYAVLREFTGSGGDGANPAAALTLSGSTLYGTTGLGGSYGGDGSWNGTVFKVNTNGTGYTVLRQFTSGDGTRPTAALSLLGSVLYGATQAGGSSGYGTLFKMNTNGTSFAVLKYFLALTDVSTPRAGLVSSGGVLYGTTPRGGSGGTVFKVNSDGTDFTVLKHFSGSEGVAPLAPLTLSGNVLYGTTFLGGSSYNGTVFKVNTDGSGYTVLKHFLGSDGLNPSGRLTLSSNVLYGTTGSTIFKVNTDATDFTVLKYFVNDDTPVYSGLTLSGSVLYGTTQHGGSSGYGTVFAMNTDGTGYTVLRNFNGSDGSGPGDLTISGNTLYGTTGGGGSGGMGTVFKLNTDGTGFAVLKHFIESQAPSGGLTLSGGVLYGTTDGAGGVLYSDLGAIFKLNTDGTGFELLKKFEGFSSEGARPEGSLTLSGGALYGTTREGGSADMGTVFKLELPITLNIARDGSGDLFIRISSVSDVTYRLQRAASVTGTWSDLATNTAPASGLIEYHETSPPPGQSFYRTVHP